MREMAEYYMSLSEGDYTVVVEVTIGTEGKQNDRHGRQAYIVPATWLSADRKHVVLPQRVRNPFAKGQKLNFLTADFFALKDKYSDNEMHQKFQTIPFPVQGQFKEHSLKG
jgi:hypothetical protein